MAYYTYYQNSQPTWGTQQYQFLPPPMPMYQPQPSWHGGDYYRAHSDSPDNTLFDYVWSKVRNVVGGAGMGRKEAHHWWKRVYGGLVRPSELLPREIGAAAGYEAFRCWQHHRTIYVQPLSDDHEREREALIGLAAAEATKLWAYTQRSRDKYGRMEASEVAAATASRMLSKDYVSASYTPYERSSHSRRRSISATRYTTRPYPLDDAFYDDDDDDAILGDDYLDIYPRSSRSERRNSSSSRHRSSSRYRSRSPVTFTRRSPSPVVYGTVASGSAATYPTVTYDPALGPGIPGTYYPNPSPYYGTSSTGYGYQLPPTGYAGAGPYAGSSVGLPPPPSGQYLTAQDPTYTYGHHRSRSAGSYGATRPTFGY